jgi:hypothetical protein
MGSRRPRSGGNVRPGETATRRRRAEGLLAEPAGQVPRQDSTGHRFHDNGNRPTRLIRFLTDQEVARARRTPDHRLPVETTVDHANRAAGYGVGEGLRSPVGVAVGRFEYQLRSDLVLPMSAKAVLGLPLSDR